MFREVVIFVMVLATAMSTSDTLPVEEAMDDFMETKGGIPQHRELDAAGMPIKGTKSKGIDDMEEVVSRSRWCRSRRGICRTTATLPTCPIGTATSPYGRPYCMGRARRCCYPVTLPSTTPSPRTTIGPNVTWHHVGSDRFVRYPPHLNWTAARTHCQSYGLDLYEPNDITAVAIYLENNFSDNWHWIGAQGNGTYQIWLSGGIIPRSAPWFSDEYLDVGIGKCMEILTHSGWAARNQTLAAVPCTRTNNGILCG